MQGGLYFRGLVALQGHDPAASVALPRGERLDAGVVAPLEDPIGQVAEPLLDVRHTYLEDQLEAGQPRVMARDRPRSGLQAAGVVGENQLLERERERIAGCEPACALRAHLREQVRSYIKEGVARPAAQPLEAAADERIAAHRLDVERDASTRLIAVDDAQRAGGLGGDGDRAHVLQVAG